MELHDYQKQMLARLAQGPFGCYLRRLPRGTGKVRPTRAHPAAFLALAHERTVSSTPRDVVARVLRFARASGCTVEVWRYMGARGYSFTLPHDELQTRVFTEARA